MKLSNHKILITGGSSGIGSAIARRLLVLGNKVAITGRDLRKLEIAKQELGDIECIQCDMADTTAHTFLASQAKEKLGGLSILVNNAGIQKNFSLLNTEIDQMAQWVKQEIAINLAGLINLTSACLPLLRESENAAVINVSSGLAITPKASAPIYCATKAAVHSFSQGLRYQCEDTAPHIKVFELLPPLVDTAMTEGRGKNKLPPDQVAKELIIGVERDRYEINVDKVKLLRLIHRLVPSIAAKMLRNG